MAITLNLTSADEAKLNDIAAREGQSPDAVAHALFTVAFAHTVWLRKKVLDENLTLTPEEETAAIRLGLEASFAQRVTPLVEWSAEFSIRHNISEGVRPD